MVGDVAAVPTAVVDVHVDVVEGGDGASKYSLLNPPRCVLASADVLADLFFYNRTSPIIHAQNVWSYRSMLYHPSCRVIAVQLPVDHPVHFLSNKLIYVVRNIGNIYRVLLSMTQVTSSPIIPTDPHALSNLNR